MSVSTLGLQFGAENINTQKFYTYTVPSTEKGKVRKKIISYLTWRNNKNTPKMLLVLLFFRCCWVFVCKHGQKRRTQMIMEVLMTMRRMSMEVETVYFIRFYFSQSFALTKFLILLCSSPFSSSHLQLSVLSTHPFQGKTGENKKRRGEGCVRDVEKSFCLFLLSLFGKQVSETERKMLMGFRSGVQN